MGPLGDKVFAPFLGRVPWIHSFDPCDINGRTKVEENVEIASSKTQEYKVTSA